MSVHFLKFNEGEKDGRTGEERVFPIMTVQYAYENMCPIDCHRLYSSWVKQTHYKQKEEQMVYDLNTKFYYYSGVLLQHVQMTEFMNSIHILCELNTFLNSSTSHSGDIKQYFYPSVKNSVLQSRFKRVVIYPKGSEYLLFACNAVTQIHVCTHAHTQSHTHLCTFIFDGSLLLLKCMPLKHDTLAI